MKKIVIIICIFYLTKIDYCHSHMPFIKNEIYESDPLLAASRISISGMEVQSERLKIISQNIANSEVTGMAPGSDPYRRKVIFFENNFDAKAGAELVKVKRVAHDQSPFILKYQPNHPAANKDGYVKYPNVNVVVETVDSKESQRSFDANTNALEIAKSNQIRVIDLMK